MATKQYYKSRGEHLATREEKFSTWKTKNKQPVKKTKVLNGKNIPYMVTEEIDQAEVTEGYNINDFAIENLQEIGMDKQLNVTFAQLSSLQLIDRLEQGAGEALDRMDAESWAKAYIERTQQQQQQQQQED